MEVIKCILENIRSTMQQQSLNCTFWVRRLMGYALVYPSVMLVTCNQPERCSILGLLAGNSKLHACDGVSCDTSLLLSQKLEACAGCIAKINAYVMGHSFNYRIHCFARHASSGLCLSFLAVSQNMNVPVLFLPLFQLMLWWDLTLIHTRV
jgi:hypothetical protein